MTQLRWTSAVALLAAVLGTAACGKNGITYVPPEDPAAPLFEVEGRNSAWGPYWAGFYVDGEGRVYHWDRSDAIDPTLEGDVLTPAQLEQKYAARRTLVKTLPTGEALQRYALVSDAAEAGLADTKYACADAGIQAFSAWAYDAGDGRYHRILLHQRGDLATTRRSDAARTLWTWLDTATRDGQGGTGCDPYG